MEFYRGEGQTIGLKAIGRFEMTNKAKCMTFINMNLRPPQNLPTVRHSSTPLSATTIYTFLTSYLVISYNEDNTKFLLTPSWGCLQRRARTSFF